VPTLRLKAAAALVGMDPETLRALAAGGKVPAAKPARAWVFIEADLEAWLRGQYVGQAQEGGKGWQFTGAARSGGASGASAARALASQLARPIGPRRRNTTTDGARSSGASLGSANVHLLPGTRPPSPG
jgi:hypothetical protein